MGDQHTVVDAPLHIMHISDNLLPTLGGLERAVDALARSWVTDGHTVTVVGAQHPSAPDAEEPLPGMAVRRLPLGLARLPGAYVESGRVFFPPLADPVFRRAFRRLLVERRPDVAHVHGWVLYSVIDELAAAGVPVVTTAHDYGQVCAAKTMVDADERRCSGPGLTKCVGCSFRQYGVKGVPLALGLRHAGASHRSVASHLAISRAVAAAGSAPRPADRRPMSVVPSFIADSLLVEASSAPTPSWVPPGPFILYVGAVGRHKGVHTLLDAYALLRERAVTTAPLVIVGMPRPHEPFDLDRPGVIHVENRPHHEVMGAWRAASIGVVPSLMPEALGQTAVEALASGTPLVVAGHGGLLDVVDDGRYAELFTPGDVADLAEKLTLLLTDESRAASLAAAGPSRAAEFTLSSVRPRVLAEYRSVIAAASGARR